MELIEIFKMKYSFVKIFTLLISFQTIASPEWGKTGHRTVGAIAEKYLSKKTNKKIQKLLKGESLAFVSIHADEIKSDHQYDEFYPWHYVNFPPEKKYGEEPVNEKGDLVQGIKKCILIIKDENTSADDKRFYLKILVHLVGDLHQPLHVGNAHDKGGNAIKVLWFGKETNLHRIWDSDMIDDYKMSYSELAENETMLSEAEVEAIQKGTLLDWVYESKKLAEKVYASAKDQDALRYKYGYDFFPLVRSQLQKGGIRLAYLLEMIFKNDTARVDEFFTGV